MTYEGDILPEDAGWNRSGTLDAERWLNAGTFCQFAELGAWKPGPIGETDVYMRSLQEFDNSETFFVETRLKTDAPSEILDLSATPVSLSAFGSGPTRYQFTFTDARVQLTRSTMLPLVFVDVEPETFHTYRVELVGDQEYRWFVDGEEVDSGTPTGVFPSFGPNILFAARHHYFDTVTHWDYIRYGVIPQDGSGDFDSDGVVSDIDTRYFVECLDDPEIGSWPGCQFADFDSNGTVNLADYAEFQIAFTE